MRVTSVIFEKQRKANNLPMGENSPNLLTLVTAPCIEVAFPASRTAISKFTVDESG
jgi:hypothetical protein